MKPAHPDAQHLIPLKAGAVDCIVCGQRHRPSGGGPQCQLIGFFMAPVELHYRCCDDPDCDNPPVRWDVVHIVPNEDHAGYHTYSPVPGDAMQCACGPAITAADPGGATYTHRPVTHIAEAVSAASLTAEAAHRRGQSWRGRLGQRMRDRLNR